MEQLAANPALGHNTLLTQQVIAYTKSIYSYQSTQNLHALMILLALNPSMPFNNNLVRSIITYSKYPYRESQHQREFICALAANPVIGQNKALMDVILTYINNIWRTPYDTQAVLQVLSKNPSTYTHCQPHHVCTHHTCTSCNAQKDVQIMALGTLLVVEGLIKYFESE